MLMVFIAIIPSKSIANGVSFYDGCIFNYVTNASNSNGESFTLSSVPDQCHTQCTNSCQKTFSATNSGQQEINNDLIYQCIQSCQGGKIFTAHKKRAKTIDLPQSYNVTSDNNTTVKKTSIVKIDTYSYDTEATSVPIENSCCIKSDQNGCKTTDDFPDQNIYVSNETFSPDNTVTLALSHKTTPGNENKVYACGRRSIILTPIFPNVYNKFSQVVEGGDASTQASVDHRSNAVDWLYFKGQNGLDTGKISAMKSAWVNSGSLSEWKSSDMSHACFPAMNDKINSDFINNISSNPLMITNNSLWLCGSQFGFYKNIQACRWGVFLSSAFGGTIQSGINFNILKYNSATGFYSDNIIYLQKDINDTTNTKYFAINIDEYNKCAQNPDPIQCRTSIPKKAFNNNQSMESILKQGQFTNNNGIDSDGVFNKVSKGGIDYLVEPTKFKNDYNSQIEQCVKNQDCRMVSDYNKKVSMITPDASNVLFQNQNYHDIKSYGVSIDNSFQTTPKSYPISSQDPSCYLDWHVRNANYTNTGIYVANGDEFAISWGGDTFIGNGNISSYVDYKLAKYAYTVGGPGMFGYSKISNMDTNLKSRLISPEKLLREISGLDIGWIKNDGSLNEESIFGEDGRSENNDRCQNGFRLPIKKDTWYGLKGSVSDGPMVFQDKDKNSDPTTLNCSDIIDPGLSRYSFTGTMQGLSANRYGLSLKHRIPNTGNLNVKEIKQNPFSTEGMEYYQNVLGGQQVSINWGGCPMKVGDGIQCGFLAVDDNSSDNSMNSKPAVGNIKADSIQWQDLSSSFIENGRVSIKTPELKKDTDTKYRLYCRLDTSKAIASVKTDPRSEVSAMSKPSSAIGGYNIVIESALSPDWKQTNSLMRQIIDQVMQTLLGTTCVYGKEQVGGLVKVIYQGVSKNVAPYVTVLLILFLCFTGIAYMLGIAKMNQQDMLNRILKIAFIVAVTSPAGWDFFGGKMIQAFSCGSLQIASQVVIDVNSKNASDALYNKGVANQPTSIYDEVLDGPRVMIWNDVVWKKMGALFITGLTGIILVIIIMISAALIWLATIRAGLIFIFSIIAMCLLFITAPVFFVFILFSQTKSMFDEWCKNVIAYALVPVVLFGTMSLFAMIVITLIYATLNFTICPTCVIKIPILNICMLSGWQSIAASHYPPVDGIMSFFSPMGALPSGLCLIIASYGMLQFAKMSTEVVIRVVTFNASIQRAGIGGLPDTMLKTATQTTMPVLQKGFKKVSDFVKRQ